MRNIPGDTGPKPPQKPPEAELKAADRLGYIADLAGELGTMARVGNAIEADGLVKRYRSVVALDELWTVSDSSGDQVSLLESIRGPEDLKKLAPELLGQLAEEIRVFLVDAVRATFVLGLILVVLARDLGCGPRRAALVGLAGAQHQLPVHEFPPAENPADR